MHCGLVLGRRDPASRLRSRPEQPGQPGEVAGGHRQDEAGTDPLDAAVDGLGEAADGLAPAERLLDPLAMLLGKGVALVPGRADVDRRMSGFSRDMGRDAGLSQVAHKTGAVLAPVRAERQLACRARRVGVDHGQRRPALGMAVGPGEIGLLEVSTPVLHQGMADEAQHRAGTWRLLVEANLRVGSDPSQFPQVGMGRLFRHSLQPAAAIEGGRPGAGQLSAARGLALLQNSDC